MSTDVKSEVIIKPRLAWQEQGCLFCSLKATKTAVIGIGPESIYILCCASDPCIKQATARAAEEFKRRQKKRT